MRRRTLAVGPAGAQAPRQVRVSLGGRPAEANASDPSMGGPPCFSRIVIMRLLPGWPKLPRFATLQRASVGSTDEVVSNRPRSFRRLLSHGQKVPGPLTLPPHEPGQAVAAGPEAGPPGLEDAGQLHGLPARGEGLADHPAPLAARYVEIDGFVRPAFEHVLRGGRPPHSEVPAACRTGGRPRHPNVSPAALSRRAPAATPTGWAGGRHPPTTDTRHAAGGRAEGVGAPPRTRPGKERGGRRPTGKTPSLHPRRPRASDPEDAFEGRYPNLFGRVQRSFGVSDRRG